MVVLLVLSVMSALLFYACCVISGECSRAEEAREEYLIANSVTVPMDEVDFDFEAEDDLYD